MVKSLSLALTLVVKPFLLALASDVKCLALTSEAKAKGLTSEANGLTSEAES